MSTKVLDISYWQGNVDFSKIKKSGYSHIILRAGYGTTVDPNFYTYAKSCALNGINIGVYWFCYSTTIAEVKKEAEKCIETIKNYNIDLPVFYDFEYDTITKAKKKGITLGKNECSKFTIEFCEAVKKSGYTPGYYANVDYYKNYYSDDVKNKGYVLWIAHYLNDRSLHDSPIPCDFFQYSDAGKVDGIGGSSVDLDVCYTDKYLDCRNLKKEEKTLSVDEVINAVINTAKKELGYLEKKSNAQLDDKTNNAGYNNYTKYWRDIKPDYQGQPWCACFVSWVFKQVFGLETAKKLLKHWPYVYCPTLGNLFTKHANPEVGDIVIFYRNGVFAHTGIVISVNGDYFETIEGNASSTSGITPNGGAVVQKGYYNSNLPGTKFCRPDYSIVSNIDTSSISSDNSSPSTPNPSTPATSTGNNLIKNAQIHLNNFVGCNIQTDGIKGPETMKTFRKALQIALNKDMDTRLVVDGVIGSASKSVLKKVCLKSGSKGYLVTVLEIGMLLNNIDPKGVECPGVFGSGLESSVKNYQKSKVLTVDGIAGYNTFMALCA